MKFTSRESKLRTTQKTVAIELGLADQKKAIELLYSQYSKPIQTCVQELVSNAFDAHKDAGRSHIPVKITAPNALNEYVFSVRDYGKSMNMDTIKNVYMRVNASTKSKDNKAIGGFGIGSKTPWAYTDSFVLKTFLDGTETHYLLVKGRSSVVIVYIGETTEDNGCEVTFKTKERNEQDFKEAIKRISLCAEVKPNVNFKSNLSFEKEVDITPLVRVVKSDLLSNGYIYFNIGGVLYQLNSSDYFHNRNTPWRANTNARKLEDFTNNSTIIIDAPIGSILPLQTREGLFKGGEEGTRNKAMIKHIVNYALREVERSIAEDRARVKCPRTALDYFANGLLSCSERFTFEDITVDARGLTFGESHVSMITRSSKQYRRSKNERGRKDTSKYIRHSELKGGEVYFSELSGNKARLISRFHRINAYNDVVVLEKELMTDYSYEWIKNMYNAVNIETVEIPKRESAPRAKIDTSKVVWYYQGSRAERGGKLDLSNPWTYKTMVIEKGTNPNYHHEIYRHLGYRIIAIAKSHMDKVLALPNFYTEDEAYCEETLLKSYISHRIRKGVRKLTPKNELFISKQLPETKQKLFAVGDESLELDLFSQWHGKALAEDLREKYEGLIRRTVKASLRRRARAWVLANKAPIAIYTDLYKLPENAKQDLAEYVKAKCGVSHA